MTTSAPAFATLVVGSLPRPLWVRDVVYERKDGRMSEAEANHHLDAAIPTAIRMQERAGLDYVSDGEWRRESYVKVFAEAVGGFENDLILSGGTRAPNLMYPAVVRELQPRRPIAADDAKFLQAQTESRTIVAVPSPYTIARRMWSEEHSRDAYPTRDEFMEACIPIVRDEIRALADLGVDAVQLDDPWLALLVDASYRDREGITDIDGEIERCVRGVNGAAEGNEDVFLSVHMCHAHFDRKHATKGPYDLVIGALADMHVQRVAIELATPDAGGVDALRNFPKDKLLGLGVIDHTDPHVETPDEVVARAERAMEHVPAGRITLNPDCGFAPSATNPMDFDEAYLKLRAMCQGAQQLREKYV